MTGKKGRLFPGRSAKSDSSNINPSSSNNAAPSSSQGTGTSSALPITPQANAYPAQDEISEVGSSLTSDSLSLAHAGRDKVAEIGSPSTPSAPNPEKLRDHAERAREAAEQYNKGIREATEGLNEESDVAELYAVFDLISQLSDFIKKEKRDKKEKNKKTEENKKENKKENELSEPKLAIDSWLGSKNLLELKEVLYEAINAAKEFASRGDAKKMVRGFLKDIGGGQVFNIAFIVVANAWERYEDMSKSEEACLSLLEEINKFAKIVIDLQKVLQNDPESKKRMEDDVNEAIELIIETSIACCTQIEASKKSRYWGTTGGGGELTKLEKQLEQTYTRIQLIMEAAKELDKENIDGDFSDLINYISRLFDFIEEKKKGKNQSMPKAAVGSCLASDNFLRLKDVVSEGVNKDIATVHGKTFLMGFLKGMGMAHMVTTGFLVAASILERHEAVSANKEACLYLLKQMNILAKYVQELQQRPWLKNRMEARMKEATMLIVEASIDCCTQIGASELSRFNGEALAKFQKKLADTQAEMRLCQFDVINQIDMRLRKGQELQYPEYPKDAVGIEVPLKDVIERLEMETDKNAVAVIVHGFGGMGKTTLADAVFARLFEEKTEGYKYSYVRLFDTIASVPDVVELQTCILTDLMMGEESEIPDIRRYEEGQQVIEEMLEKEAAFIYIDNVLLPNKIEQGRDALHHLLPKNMRNARKLRLLLTTRDKDAVRIRIRGVKPVFYRIEGLPHEKALDLFKKAPHGDSLQQLHTHQLNDLVNICEGVPKLMMVVAGFISSEKDVQQAYGAVLEASQNNWNGKIGNDMECCIFAYENLEETLKEIFLDICVFCQGRDWETLSKIVGEAELKMLEDRALVTKDVKSMTVRVHDVMLAIGLDKKGERFRFTRASDFEKFLKKDNDQLQKIRGIWSSDDSNLLYLPASKLDSMHRSLRVVILAESTKVAGKCTEIFKELVIFRARDSDLPFDKSKLGEFKKLKLSHLICKSEDLEKLNEGSLHGMKAQRGKDSIFEIGSSSRPPGDSIFESGASSSPNVCEVGSAVAAVEIETVDVNLSELSNYVSQLLNFRKGNDLLKPRGAKYFLPDSKRFFKLKEFLSEGTNAVESFIRGERKTFIGHFLDGMEMPHMVATGFLVQANVLERYESISTNREACLSLLNEMNTLAEHVKQLHERPGLREGMKVSIREATMLIVEASLACCTQIDASNFSGFFLSTPGMEELAKFEKELQKMGTCVRNQMDLCPFDAVPQLNPPSTKGIENLVGIEEALHKVINLLEWESDKNAVAVILHGIGGMGKTTLADAVFARLFRECKFCFVRLFQDIKSTPNVIELQKSILRQLKGEEPEEIRSYEEGQQVIEDMLEKEEAFICIDNVLLPDKREQGPDALTQLLPKNMANAKKLRLLITTRDKDAARMTMSKGVEKKFYQIQSLRKVEAETLLRNELNGNEIQLNDNQIDGIVKICGGVPALLKVLAGFINGGEGSAVQNYETLMREAKEKNWKGFIGESIEQYVFAYDKLEDELKDPFLEICSFFRGWDWKELSDIVGDSELKRLEEMALVTRDVKSMTATVHDVILEVGLQRAEGNRFRLTTATEKEKFSHIKDEDLQKIKGIWTSDNEDPLRIPASKLDLMSGSLRVLKLGRLTYVERKCEKKFEELVFFSAITSYLPFYVSKLKWFKKLRHLCYREADLEDLIEMPSNLRHVDIKLNSLDFWVSSNCIQPLRNLRVLRLIVPLSPQFEIVGWRPGDMVNGLEEAISGCQYLEELSISGSRYVGEVSISTLKSLRVLRMDHCFGLTQPPKGLGSLTSLKELDLYGCNSLKELPSELENLTSLQKLDLSSCKSLKGLPSSLQKLRSLQELHLFNCNSLEDLPNNLEGLSLLRLLDLSWCTNIKNLPLDFQCLTSLEVLDVRNCHKLEGKWLHSMLKMKKLQILSIAGSELLEERWEKIQAQQCNQSWSCAVYTKQGLSNEENLLKQLQSEFGSMLTYGEREPLNISGLPLHTLLLVMFDGQQEFRPDFPLPLLESIDDIQTHFEMVYFGNHWDQLPKKVADRIVGHAPANRDAKALFQKLLSLFLHDQKYFDPYLTSSFQMTAEIVSGEKGDKYLSRWKFFGHGSAEKMEDFVVTKCGRYVKLKQLAERPGGSPIALLTELFRGGEEEISLSFLKNKDGESTKVGVDELQGKTILLDIRPANICFDIPLLALVEMYNVVKKERFNFEIITVPIFQGDTTLDVYEKISRKVPWLVLENPWQLTNATKYFLVEGRPEPPRGWDRWYPNTMRIIESDGTIAPYRNPGVLRMVNTWGAAAYPFTAEKEAELIQKEETQMKAMSHAMFLFQHLERVAEQLREATGQQKLICLCSCHFTNSMKKVLTELSDIIYIIYIPRFHSEAAKGVYFTATIFELYYPLEPSKMSSAAMRRIFSLSLSEYEAMRFWVRIRYLKEGIKATEQNQLTEMLMICDDYLNYGTDSWMFIMDEDGNLITTKGKRIVKLLSEKYSDDRVKELMQQLLKGNQTSWKKTLVELEEMPQIDGEDNEGSADDDDVDSEDNEGSADDDDVDSEGE